MLENLRENITSAIDTLKDGIAQNPLTSTGVAAGSGAILGGIVGAGVVAVAKRKKKKSNSKSTGKKNSRSRSRRRARRVRKTPYTAGKGKDRSSKRIRFTKNGQPYLIMASGKAKFISKKGAKISRKRKGGRY